MKKLHYHITFWQKTPNGSMTAHCWEPVVFVSDRHPVEWVKEWEGRNVRDRVISNWQVISKAEFDNFRSVL